MNAKQRLQEQTPVDPASVQQVEENRTKMEEKPSTDRFSRPRALGRLPQRRVRQS